MMPTETGPVAADIAFLQRLKTDTAPYHTKLEESPITHNLMTPSVTTAHYQHYLMAMRNVVRWCEEQVFPLITDTIPDLPQRKKLASLDADLKQLGVDVTDLPPFHPTPALSSKAFALGAMYVLEGSSLGGMVILKHLLSRGVVSDDNTQFLSVYGKQTGPLWKSFLAPFSAYAVTHGNEDYIIASACDTFKAMDIYFHTLSVHDQDQGHR